MDQFCSYFFDRDVFIVSVIFFFLFFLFLHDPHRWYIHIDKIIPITIIIIIIMIIIIKPPSFYCFNVLLIVYRSTSHTLSLFVVWSSNEIVGTFLLFPFQCKQLYIWSYCYFSVTTSNKLIPTHRLFLFTATAERIIPIDALCSLIHTLGRRDGGAFLGVQSEFIHLAILDCCLTLVGIEVGEGVLHPIHIVAFLEVLTCVGTTRFLTT